MTSLIKNLFHIVDTFVITPAVMVHEASHYIAALALKVDILHFSLFYTTHEDEINGKIVLGDAPFVFRLIIGMAPLLINGSLAVVLASWIDFNNPITILCGFYVITFGLCALPSPDDVKYIHGKKKTIIEA